MLSTISSLGVLRLIRRGRILRWVAQNFRTHTTESERKVLYQLAFESRCPRTVIEIGSYVGASTVCLAAGLKDGGGGKVFCVDTWGNETMPEGERDTMKEFLQNTAIYSDMIIPIRKRSETLVAADLPESVDPSIH